MMEQTGQSDNDARTDEFVKLLVPNQRRVLSYILCSVANKSDAEDIYQETIAEMWKKYDHFSSGTDFVRWGIQIAKYKILNFRRKVQNSKIIFSDAIIELIQEESKQKLEAIDDYLKVLRDCTRKLSVRQVQFLRLRYEDDMSYRKIGTRTGLTHQAISKAMSRIHAQLVQCVNAVLRPEAER